MSESKSNSKAPTIFSAGVCVLVTLAATVVIIGHAFNVLLSIGLIVALVAAAGPLLSDWVLYGTSWWAIHEKQDKGVIFTAFGGSTLLLFTMLISGGLVLGDYALQKSASTEAVAVVEKDKAASALKQGEADNETRRAIAEEQAWAATVAQWKAAGFSERFIRQQAQARDKLKQQEAVKSPSMPLSFAPIASQAAEAKATEPDIYARLKSLIHIYASFWVFVVPPLIAGFCYAALKLALIWPGGATLMHTSDGVPADDGTPGEI